MPRASVIIPAYHSHATLGKCLEALRAQSFRDFETLVVNSSPEDETARVVRRFPEVHFEQSAARLFPHAARNRGAASALGEILVFTDPDCRARPDWLEKLLAAAGTGPAVVGGAVVPPKSARRMDRAIHLSKFHMVLGAGGLPEHAILPTANVCYTRGVFEDVGPFDGEYFCGDSLIAARALVRGYPLRFEPGAVVEHAGGGTARTHFRERYRRGREFAGARIESGDMTRTRAIWLASMWPARAASAVASIGRNAFRAGDAATFVESLPLQLAAQVLWAVGESEAFARHAIGAQRMGSRSARMSKCSTASSAPPGPSK